MLLRISSSGSGDALWLSLISSALYTLRVPFVVWSHIFENRWPAYRHPESRFTAICRQILGYGNRSRQHFGSLFAVLTNVELPSVTLVQITRHLQL
jgi:hypothetical protein